MTSIVFIIRLSSLISFAVQFTLRSCIPTCFVLVLAFFVGGFFVWFFFWWLVIFCGLFVLLRGMRFGWIILHD